LRANVGHMAELVKKARERQEERAQTEIMSGMADSEINSNRIYWKCWENQKMHKIKKKYCKFKIKWNVILSYNNKNHNLVHPDAI